MLKGREEERMEDILIKMERQPGVVIYACQSKTQEGDTGGFTGAGQPRRLGDAVLAEGRQKESLAQTWAFEPLLSVTSL